MGGRGRGLDLSIMSPEAESSWIIDVVMRLCPRAKCSI